MNSIIIWTICIIAILIVGKIFLWPLKLVLKLVLNSILGGLLILLINFFGTYIGIHIGLNIATALVIGILGLPGAVLLIVFSIIL